MDTYQRYVSLKSMVTMNEVATRAGVAQSTVSYVLNDRHEQRGISPETRRRVIEAAQELGYRPNRLARAMVTGSNPMFGLLARAPDVEQVGYMLVGALHETERSKFSLKLLSYDGSGALAQVVDQCLELKLAGLIALHLPPTYVAQLMQELDAHMPLAVLDSSFSLDRGIRVISDDGQGIQEAVEYLVGLGHRRIGFITVRGDGAAQWREEAFVNAMRSQGVNVPPELIVDGKGFWNVQDVEDAVHALFSIEAIPTAVIAAGDAMAMTALRVLRRRGLQVPEDVSVIGFSNLIMARHADPPLTTVAQPFREMGSTAVRYLLEEVQRRRRDEAPVRVEQLLPTHLLVRESCGPCRQS